MADPESPPSQDSSIKNEQLTDESGEISHQSLKRKLDIATESDSKTTENESPCKTTDNITTKPILDNESSTKKPRLETSDTEVSSPDSENKLSKKELQRIERQQQRDLERIEKEKKKEEERLRKQDERIKRQEAKDLEKELKRKKLEEEKLQRERKREEERLEREQKREEERLEREQKKEEERIKKQIEKDEKEKLRLEKKRQLDEEKESKEIERKKVEEEKRRAEELKERNQKKISSFFQVGRKVTPPQKSSISRFAESTNEDDDLTSYEKDFLPFFIKKNVKMASSGQLDNQQLSESKSYLDNVLKNHLSSQSSQLKDFFLSIKPQPSAPVSSITPEDIITALNSSNSTEAQIYDMLQKIPPIKYISFYENSKPPFIGTWCSANHQQIKLTTSDPTNSSLTGFDYDYDSDLEWNKEDEEGEDLDEDEEEEEDLIVADEDDIDDFVENNAETTTKKFHSLVVINKWNDGTNDEIFGGMTTTSIISEIAFPMDPFHDYWNKKEEQIPQETAAIPLKLGSETAPNTPQKKSTPNILTPQKKTIKDPAIIAGLIQFIETNQEFTIGTLVELSKKEFKDFTKALLKNTIQDIATYNKKTSNWDVKEDIKKKYLST
jgi:Uncharacterized conserved protein